MGSLKRALGVLALAASVSVLGSASAQAVPNLKIQITGLDLVYSGGYLYDSTSVSGGSGQPALADPVSQVDFIAGGSSVGTLSAPGIWVDSWLLTGGFTTAFPGVQHASGSVGIFDLLSTGSSQFAWGLALDVTSFEVFYVGSNLTLLGTGNAVLCPVCSPNPNLPFSLGIQNPVTFTFSGDVSNATFDGLGNLTGFDFAGTGTISGPGGVVPEPGTLLLVGSGVVALALRRRRNG